MSLKKRHFALTELQLLMEVNSLTAIRKAVKTNNTHYRSGVVMSLIGETPHLVIDFEMIHPSSTLDEVELFGISK